MGGMEFYVTEKGSTPQEAFDEAVRQARYDWGHSGYTGTIAEKAGFKVFHIPKDMSAEDFFEKIATYDAPDDKSLHAAWKIYNEKWGPAVCVPLKDENGTITEYAFCGWASS